MSSDESFHSSEVSSSGEEEVVATGEIAQNTSTLGKRKAAMKAVKEIRRPKKRENISFNPEELDDMLKEVKKSIRSSSITPNDSMRMMHFALVHQKNFDANNTRLPKKRRTKTLGLTAAAVEYLGIGKETFKRVFKSYSGSRTYLDTTVSLRGRHKNREYRIPKR